MAPVANRLTIVDGRLDFVQRNRVARPSVKSSSPRSVSNCRCCSSINWQNLRNSSRLLICVACCSLAMTSGLKMWASPLRRH